MKKQLILWIILVLLVGTASATVGGRIFAGYGAVKWGTSFDGVSRTYRNGTVGRIGEQIVYKQVDPEKIIRQRTFGFRNNALDAVSVTFSAPYVRKVGAENLLARFMKLYGEGRLEPGSTVHLTSYYWEDVSTRITFAYSPSRPEMTVLMFQQKNN